MAEDFVAFVRAMDDCWLERRFDDLPAYLSDAVVMVAPGGVARFHGIDAAVDSYREFMTRCRVELYETSDHVVTRSGDSAIVEYGWEMAWEDDGERHQAKGREVLVLARLEGWKVIWRTQLPG